MPFFVADVELGQNHIVATVQLIHLSLDDTLISQQNRPLLFQLAHPFTNAQFFHFARHHCGTISVRSAVRHPICTHAPHRVYFIVQCGTLAADDLNPLRDVCVIFQNCLRLVYPHCSILPKFKNLS